MTQYYNLKNDQDSEEIKQMIKTEVTTKKSLEAKDSGYSEMNATNTSNSVAPNVVPSSVENNNNAATSLNSDRKNSVSSIASHSIQNQLTPPSITLTPNLQNLKNQQLLITSVCNNIGFQNENNNSEQIAIQTASEALSSTIILAKPNKHQLQKA